MQSVDFFFVITIRNNLGTDDVVFGGKKYKGAILGMNNSAITGSDLSY